MNGKTHKKRKEFESYHGISREKTQVCAILDPFTGTPLHPLSGFRLTVETMKHGEKWLMTQKRALSLHLKKHVLLKHTIIVHEHYQTGVVGDQVESDILLRRPIHRG